MANPQPPTNYQWKGNNLSYDLPEGTTGLSLKYKADGQSIWIIVFESQISAPSSVFLPSNLGPTGIILGMTMKTSTEGWGNPGQEPITNTP